MPQTTGYFWTIKKDDVRTDVYPITGETGYRAAHGVLVKALSTNTDNILVGNPDDQDFILEPGEAIEIEIDNPNLIWAKSASGIQKLVAAIV